MSDESFANAPVSITEIRSDRTGHSETWTVRDALVWMLRSIDRGEINPRQLVALWIEPSAAGPDAISIHHTVAGPLSTLELMGMLARAQHELQGSPTP